MEGQRPVLISAQGNALGIRIITIKSPERAAQNNRVSQTTVSNPEWDALSGLGIYIYFIPRALPWAIIRPGRWPSKPASYIPTRLMFEVEKNP